MDVLLYNTIIDVILHFDPLFDLIEDAVLKTGERFLILGPYFENGFMLFPPPVCMINLPVPFMHSHIALIELRQSSNPMFLLDFTFSPRIQDKTSH